MSLSLRNCNSSLVYNFLYNRMNMWHDPLNTLAFELDQHHISQLQDPSFLYFTFTLVQIEYFYLVFFFPGPSIPIPLSQKPLHRNARRGLAQSRRPNRVSRHSLGIACYILLPLPQAQVPYVKYPQKALSSQHPTISRADVSDCPWMLIYDLWIFIDKAASLEPWFPAHLQRDIYFSLLHLEPSSTSTKEKKAPAIPDSIFKASLLRRAAEDIRRIMALRSQKQALTTLVQRGSVGDDLWQRFQRAEKEMEDEVKDVVSEVW